MNIFKLREEVINLVNIGEILYTLPKSDKDYKNNIFISSSKIENVRYSNFIAKSILNLHHGIFSQNTFELLNTYAIQDVELQNTTCRSAIIENMFFTIYGSKPDFNRIINQPIYSQNLNKMFSPFYFVEAFDLMFDPDEYRRKVINKIF
ncbi:hypothetical protein [uncultured Chryseobacterium sp.]|uniref:hypothetical protein n=1 Tax=uncultured Chryseobacterium sp. TaxID=259322 RepID=UPI00258358E2|nr:hypothetical protein [uncultured Chryseobacterium sp.]